MTVSLTRLERLLAEATERPWQEITVYAGRAEIHADASGEPIAVLRLNDFAANAALIAEAVNALPALIAAAKALNEAVILHHDHRQDDVANAELHRRAQQVNEALAAFSFEAEAVDRERIETIREQQRLGSLSAYPGRLQRAVNDLLAALAEAEAENARLREALEWCDFVEDVEAPEWIRDDKPLTVEVTRTAAGWRKTQDLYHAALASRPGEGAAT